MQGIRRDITVEKRTYADPADSHERVRELAAHLQLACEQERKRIARDLHDALGQALTSLKISACALTDTLREQQMPCCEEAAAMEERIDEAIQVMRQVIGDLRPALLDTFGLPAAVEWLADRFGEQTGLDAVVEVEDVGNRQDGELETALFRVLQELLNNVTRHAQASRVRITLKEVDGVILMRVVDDGGGFDVRAIDETKSFGLLGIRERIRRWNGTVEIKSMEGCGTRVTVKIPN